MQNSNNRSNDNKTAIYVACSVILLFLGLLFYPFPDEGYDPTEGRLADAFHLPMGFVLSLILAGVLEKFAWPLPLVCGVVFIGCALLGGIGEVIQPYFGRGASLDDWIFGLMGVVVGLSFYYLLRKGDRRRVSWISWFVCASFLQIIALIPAGEAYLSTNKRDSLFPRLTDFSSDRKLHLWKPILGNGKLALKLAEFGSDPYLLLKGQGQGFFGAELSLPDKSWGDFATLHLELVGEENDKFVVARLVELRIDDCHGSADFKSRYHGTFEVTEGLNKFAVPLSYIVNAPQERDLDLSCIQRMVVFTSAWGEKFSFGIKNIWLE